MSNQTYSLPVIRKQTKYFTIISTIAAVFQIVLGIVGLAALNGSDSLGCHIFDAYTQRSGTWIFLKSGSTVFVTMHILAMII